MQLLVIIITFLIVLGLFANFLLGTPGNEKLKQRLVDFYVAVEEGDWAALYRQPASAVYMFMNHILAENQFTFRYLLRTFRLSFLATLFLFAVTFSYAYIKVAITGDICPIPPFSRFLEIPRFMSDFLIFIFIINFVADYFSWSISQRILKHLSGSRGLAPLCVLLFAPVAMGLLLYILYLIYLPISIMVQMSHLGRHYDLNLLISEFIFIIKINYADMFGFFTFWNVPFHLACTGRPHTQFMISYMQTFQILAIETLVPIALLISSCAFGAIAYWTRPITQRPLSLIIARLDSSEKPVIAMIVGALTVISGLLGAAITYFKG